MTGSPLNQCKTVLAETENDIEKSKELLRKRGLADAEKRSSRSATQGLIGLHDDSDNCKATMVQFACETDFVAKTDRFKDALNAIVHTVHAQDGLSVEGSKSDDAEIIESLLKNV